MRIPACLSLLFCLLPVEEVKSNYRFEELRTWNKTQRLVLGATHFMDINIILRIWQVVELSARKETKTTTTTNKTKKKKKADEVELSEAN